jgi:hypothetical protein
LEPLEGAWRGSRYVSPDGSSWFAAYALPVDAEPVAAHMDTIARQKGEAITYFRRDGIGLRSQASKETGSFIGRP